MDEGDFIDYAVYTATSACLARFDGTEILESTPNPLGDKNTYFAQAFFGKREGYKILTVPTKLAPHIPQSYLEMQKRSMARSEYEREYECMFSSDINSVFPQDLIYACRSEAIDWANIEATADVAFLGVIFAKFGTDDSVIAENFHRQGINYIRIRVIPSRGTRIMEIEDAVVDMVRKNAKISKVVVDDRSLGTGPMQGLAELLGENTVVGVANHSILKDIEGGRSRYMKEDLFVNLLKLMERGKIVLDDDMKIVGALLDMKYEYYKRGGMVKIWGMENSIADAIVRAVFPIWGRQEWYGDIQGAIRIAKNA